MGKEKGQKFTLADFTNMVSENADGCTDNSWADEEVELQLPTAPTGAPGRYPNPPAHHSTASSSSSMHSGEYRPGRGPADRKVFSPANPSGLPTAPPYCLHLANLPYSATEQSLRTTLFAGFGVQDIKVPMDLATGRARGFAYVTMATREDMVRALEQLHGRELGGRQVRLDVAEQQAQQSKMGGDWRSGQSEQQSSFKTPGLGDRPGRRDLGSMDWRPSSSASPSSSSSSAYGSTMPADWRAADRPAAPDSAAFGARREGEWDASRGRDDRNSDRPGRRPAPFSGHHSNDKGNANSSSSLNYTKPKAATTITFTREDFGKKI